MCSFVPSRFDYWLVCSFVPSRFDYWLVCSFVPSRFDYCSCLLADLSKYLLRKLQRKKRKKKARVIFRSSKYDHVSPPLHRLHWLPVCHRIYYNHSPIYFSSLTGLGPQNRADILKIYVPSRQLRSSSDTLSFKSLLSKQSLLANAVLHMTVLQTGHAPAQHQACFVHSINCFNAALKTERFHQNKYSFYLFR